MADKPSTKPSTPTNTATDLPRLTPEQIAKLTDPNLPRGPAPSPEAMKRIIAGPTANPTTPPATTPAGTIPAWLQQLFNQAGLGELAEWYLKRVREGATDDQILIEMYDQPQYKTRFPAMAALRKRGQTITEGEYIQMERSYAQALDAYGLRGSTFDQKSTYTRLIEADVDVQSLEERLNDARMVAQATDPNVRDALARNYGIGVNDLMQYALDPAGIGKDHVERIARSATLQGLARTFSLDLGKSYAEQLAMDTAFENSTEADYRSALATVADLSTSQRRLAQVEGTRFSDEDAADVVVLKNQSKTLASRQRAAREAARFSGTSGLSGSTLRGPGL